MNQNVIAYITSEAIFVRNVPGELVFLVGVVVSHCLQALSKRSGCGVDDLDWPSDTIRILHLAT
jgi:hypothetical protein